jgi:signal transduction histidine kinase
MEWEWEIMGPSGIRFFAAVSASISHDIKNALAVINESAGLLEDLSLMAPKGIPLDPERVKEQARMIIKQIQKIDVMVKNLNRFAHSADAMQQDIDIVDLLNLLCTLSRRFASMRGIRLVFSTRETRILLQTNPFFLQNLIRSCIEYAVTACGGGKKIDIVLEKKESGSRIYFSGLDHDLSKMGFPDNTAQAILDALRIRCEMVPLEGRLVLFFPNVLH